MEKTALIVCYLLNGKACIYIISLVFLHLSSNICVIKYLSQIELVQIKSEMP